MRSLIDAVATRLPRIPPKTTFGGRNDPDRLRIDRFMEEIEPLLKPWRADSQRELGFVLDVGLPEAADPLVHHDLDNFLEPMARALGAERVVRARATKQVRATSSITIGWVGEPRVAADGREGWAHARVRADGIAKTAQRSIAQSLEAAAPLPWGPVQVRAVVTVGPSRNWVNAWKPLIDSLVPLLGRAPGKSEFDIEDGRIVDLELHRQVDAAIGHGVELDLAWRSLGETAGGPALTYEPGGGSTPMVAPERRAPAQHHPVLPDTVEELLTSDAFRASYGQGLLVITDRPEKTATLHRWGCGAVKERYFQQKVVDGRGKNGQYFVVPTPELARETWTSLTIHSCPAGRD